MSARDAEDAINVPVPRFPEEMVPARACLLTSSERRRCYAWLEGENASENVGNLCLERWVCHPGSVWTRDWIAIPRSGVGALELLLAGSSNVRAVAPMVTSTPNYSVEDAQRLVGDLQAILRGAHELGGITLALDLVVNFVARFLLDGHIHEDQLIGTIRKSVAPAHHDQELAQPHPLTREPPQGG